MKRSSTAAALFAAVLATVLPAAVQAQENPAEKINQLIVYGDDPCPASTDGAITVCARKDEEERFRIPKPLRDNPNASVNQGWTQRVKAYETVGATGVNSCSPIGAGGATGCMAQLINSAYSEKKQASDVQFGKLIEEERARRLQTIDADTAAEQARVEVLEKEYEARLKRERDAEAAPPTAATSAPAAPLAAPPQP
ncbi:hypothetical protein [Novosphingobium sp. PASSN1]|uniref:hypothetical protein n=1 Tax=Novosphingobium sp. PASSN1 TaxID=2015561 RepID=UPI000BC9EE00|nr:hypothetical protein [Novosphingobium sp. PASSN1]OYU36622.1 MAG: hypothetical protein CFE35_04970 [Novosphingobium sp. PASSN1]